jgi:hypothetical protein
MTNKVLQNSRRNDLHARFEQGTAANVIPPLLEVLRSHREDQGKRAWGNKEPDVSRHMELVVADLYSAWSADPEMFIGYSRNEAEFKKGGSYFDPQIGKSLLSYSFLPEVIDGLAEHGYVENHKATPGLAGMSSRMRATKKLILQLEIGGVSWAVITRSDDEEMLIFNPSDTDEVAKRLPFNDADDPRILQMRHNLRAFNAQLKETLLNLNVTDDELRDINLRLRSDPDKETIDFSRRRLCRIFKNGNWNTGGRFYGGWWQSVPREYRKHIRIEGKVTVEMDYSTIHPRILYGKENEDCPDDAYAIPGWDGPDWYYDQDGREIIKKAFNQLLNSKLKMKSESQWHLFSPDLTPNPIPTGWNNLNKNKKDQAQRQHFKDQTGKEYEDLIRDIAAYHEPIQKHFFTKAWSWLQRLDSDIAENVMVDLFGQGIVVLPVHDSFIVRVGFQGYLSGAMNRAYQEVVGVKAEVDKKEMIPSDAATIGKEGEVLTGDDMWEIISDDKDEDYKSYHLRNHQWRKAWGLVGWD